MSAQAVMSQEFVLADWPTRIVPGEEPGQWRDLRPEDAYVRPNRLLKERWVYVFELEGTHDTTPVWLAEIWACAAGKYHQVDLGEPVAAAGTQGPPRHGLSTQRSSEEEGAPVPCEGGDDCGGAAKIKLPTQIGSSFRNYLMLGCEQRLPSRALDELTAERPVWAHVKTLSLQAFNVWRNGGLHGQTKVQRTPVVFVQDPLAMGLAWSKRYRRRRDALLAWTTPASDSDETEKTTKRLQEVLLARHLLSVTEQASADVRARLEDELQGGVSGAQAAMREVIADHEEELLARDAKQRDASAQLITWLQSDVMKVYERAFLDASTDVELRGWFVNGYGRCTARLMESEAGKAFLRTFFDQEDNQIRREVLCEEQGLMDYFATDRKVFDGVLTVWGELAEAGILDRRTTVTALVSAANATFLKDADVSLKVASGSLPAGTIGVVRRSYDGSPRTRSLGSIDVMVFEAKRGVDLSTLDLGTKLAPLRLIVEAVNVVLCVQSLWQNGVSSDPTQGTVDMLGVVGTILDAGLVISDSMLAYRVLIKKEAGAAFSKTVQTRLAWVGIISGVIDGVCAGYDSYGAYQERDYSRSAGQGMVMVGSFMGAYGTYCLLAAAGASSTGVGLPLGAALAIGGALLAAGGWFVATYWADSDIEKLARFSTFGRYYGTSSWSAPWTGGPVSAWVDAPDKQVNALLHLICGFRAEAVDDRTLRIYPGPVGERSVFRVEFEFCYYLTSESAIDFSADGTWTPSFNVHCAEGEVTRVDLPMTELAEADADDPEVLAQQRATVILGDHGITQIELGVNMPEDFKSMRWSSCKLYLDYEADGVNCVPPGGQTKPVDLTLSAHLPGGRSAASKDFV